MPDNDHLLSARDITDSICGNDPRVETVVRAFVAERLGWTLDDPVDELVPLVLDNPFSRGTYVIHAKRLLERLDGLLARDWIAENGEDAHLEVLARLDERVRELTYQRDQARDALQSCTCGETAPAAGREDGEQWRAVPSAPELEASDLGRVRTVARGRILKPHRVQKKRSQDTWQVTYRHADRQRYGRVARLVCEAFHGPPPPKYVAMFLDGNSDNCRADNLRWATRTEVAEATVDRGRHRSGQQIRREQRLAAGDSKTG